MIAAYNTICAQYDENMLHDVASKNMIRSTEGSIARNNSG